jgi:hypothetical protein
LLFAFIANLLVIQPAQAQTIINVATGSDLVNALTTVDANLGTSYRINFTQSISLNANTTLPAINTSSNLIISGNDYTLNGGGVQRGFFAYAGTMMINDLTITNTTAVGGAGVPPPEMAQAVVSRSDAGWRIRATSSPLAFSTAASTRSPSRASTTFAPLQSRPKSTATAFAIIRSCSAHSRCA